MGLNEECVSGCDPPVPYEMSPGEKNLNEGEQETLCEHILPGCSKSDPQNTKWSVSTSMMQAYLFMKGPGTDMEDPLMTWISEQEDEDQEHRERGLLGGIHDAIKEQGDWKVSGAAKYDDDDERRSVFRYRRPEIDHISSPEAFDAEALEELFEIYGHAKDEWDQHVADYVSDSEGDPSDGRVSPCTFLHWVNGAKRWDAPGDKNKSRWEARQTYNVPDSRQRPPSPNTLEPRKLKVRETTAQFDEHDGRPLTAACSEFANTEPSILWSPPPVEAALPVDFYNHKFDRMDPELARALRDSVTSDAPSWGVESAEEPEVYSPSEVHEAIERYWGLSRTTDLIADKHRELALLNNHEERVNDANERYRHQIRQLKHENRKLGDCLALQRSRRDRRIMKSVDRHLRDLDYETRTKLAEIKARWKENEQLRGEFEVMRGVQERLLAEFGKESPEEVFGMFPTVWEPMEERKNRRNFS